MHRFVMDTPNNRDIDHRNHDGLDNCRSNLRVCTRSQNNRNSRPHSSSGYKGVYWDKERGKWIVLLFTNGRVIAGGRFDDKIAAARAYNRQVKQLRDPFFFVNPV